jgi:rhamnulokinase
LTARFTNQGAAAGGFCFHTNVNGMWLLKQCMDEWEREGRPCAIEALIQGAEAADAFPGVIDVDAEPLLLDSAMPLRINEQLVLGGFKPIADQPGNEPVFARVIFESLACRYASALERLEQLLGRKFEQIHILGGGGRNKLLTELTAQRTKLTVETGETESSTIGNLAVQLASADVRDNRLSSEAVRDWAERLCQR